MGDDRNGLLPPFLFKYKAIDSVEDIIRLIDIVNKSKIYCPTYRELNDPLEGQVISIGLEGHMGSWFEASRDEEDGILQGYREQYRILSLSEQCDIPQLWAHYANGYKGVCLCFSTRGVFERARRVDYSDDTEFVYANSNISISRAVKKGFTKKQQGWSYEKEWRIVQKSKFLQFEDTDLSGIVFGHKLSKKAIELIIKNIEKDIFFCKAYIDMRSLKIHQIPINYSLPTDGTHIRYLDLNASLSKKRNTYEKLDEGIEL